MNLYREKFLPLSWYNRLTGVEQVLILSASFCMSLLCFRMLYTGSLLFVFLSWNLFLAFLPFALTRYAGRRELKSRWIILLVCFAWLLLVPNSFYLITDLFHLDQNKDVPLWYDLALLLSFAWAGLVAGIASMRQMKALLDRQFRAFPEMVFLLPVMFLNGLGVYIGRYLRFNSWDVVTDPWQLGSDIAYLFLHPLRNRFDWSMIVCYALLLSLMYVAIKKLGKSL